MAEELEIDAINLDDVDDIGGIDTSTIAPTPKDITKHTEGVTVDPVIEPGTVDVNLTFDPNKDDLLDSGLKGTANDTQSQEVFFKEVGGILKDKGFFAGDDKTDITSSESLAAAFDKEVNARLSDRQKEILEYKNQGINISEVDKLESAITTTNNITEANLVDDQELAANLIMLEMKQNGIDGAKYVQMFKDAGTLTEEGMKALENRKGTLSSLLEAEKTEAQNRIQSELDTEKKRIEDFNSSLEKKEIFGRKLTDTTVNKLKNLVNNPVAYTEDGQPMNAIMKYRSDNPIEFERAIAYLFLATNEFKDVKVFDRSAETRISRKFQNAVSTISSAPDIQTNTPVSAVSKVIDMNMIDDIV